MPEVHAGKHASLIKTPRQLVVVVLLAFLIPAIGIVMIASFVTGGLKVDSRSSDQSAAAVAERLKPVGSVVIGEVPAPAAEAPPAGATPAVKATTGGAVKTAAVGGAGAGKKLYDTVCTACHAAGIAGAPKTGDKAAWKPRIATGKEALYSSAIKGKNAMPAKGGLASAADADVKAAVDYMVSQAK
jgi:cytochrome c5